MIVGIEESRHGPSDAMHNPSQPFEFLSKNVSHLSWRYTHYLLTFSLRNTRVILFSIHSDDGNPFSVNIKQHCGRSYALSWKSCQGGSSKSNLPDHRHKRWCCSPIPAKSDSLPRAHTQASKVIHQA
ncbi:hypothetical protein Tco_0740052 [Tanacetum coccineum]